MGIERLEDEVKGSLQEIAAMPRSGRYRCHEVARLMKMSLNRNGHAAVVRDGMAQYSGNFIVELLNQSGGFGHIDPRGINGKSGRIAHSWCELDDVVIDYQREIGIPPNMLFEHVTIVKRKNELQGKADYTPSGREVRLAGFNYIFIPNGHHIPYVARLLI